MTGRHRMWTGAENVEIDVPVSGAENVMVPVIRAVVRPTGDDSKILLQRRADPDEPVFGCLEIPGGRWRSGEPPLAAIRREVLEETGVVLKSIGGVSVATVDAYRSVASLFPLVVIAGIDAAFPAIHIVLIADGDGVLRGEGGESDDVRWWPLDDVRSALKQRPAEFVPSSRSALIAYIEACDSERSSKLPG